MKSNPKWDITVDGTLYFFDGEYGAEIFIHNMEDDGYTDKITCVCNKEGDKVYSKEFDKTDNLFSIQRWALDKMNYYEE